MSSYKLNYDVKLEMTSETKTESDGKKVAEQLTRGFFSRFIRRILRREISQLPDKTTESESERSLTHFQFKDLALNFSPENSDLSQGYLVWIGSGGVEYVEVDLPGDDNEMREALQGLEEIPPGHSMPMFAKKFLTRLQEKPIDAIFMLKIKCENESIKELVLELSYDMPEYIFAYQFTTWHAAFPEIETNFSAEIERTKEIGKEMIKDFKDFQSDSDTVTGLVLTQLWGHGYLSKTSAKTNELLNLLKGKHVIITYKNLNIVNADEKLADGVYKKEFSDPINGRLFGGKVEITGTSNITGEIKLEIRPLGKEVSISCNDIFGIEHPGAIVNIVVSSSDTVVNLNSSDPNKVSFVQNSIVGSGSVSLIIGSTPSGFPDDVVLTAIATNDNGTSSDSKSVTIAELSSITINNPLRNDNNGTFTSRAGENVINLIAETLPPNILNDEITWKIDDDPRDAINSGNPDDPDPGSNANFTVSPPTAPNGRRKPLSYRIRSKLTINGFEQELTDYATQDERDQCRQEYIDMGKNNIPIRGDFVDAATYANPGNFTFDEIRINAHHSIALFTIASHLEAIRGAFGHVMTVNSGFRNPIRNADIGGASESQHIYGTAADIAVVDFNGDDGSNLNMVPDPTGRDPQVGDDWALLVIAAKAHNPPPSWIEEWHRTGTWVHMDWR